MAQIMIVDDEAIITMQLGEQLTAMGYEVAGTASSGEEAVDLAQKVHPDLILMDIVMPGKIDGIEASDIIRKNYEIPVIFVTARRSAAACARSSRRTPPRRTMRPRS